MTTVFSRRLTVSPCGLTGRKDVRSTPAFHLKSRPFPKQVHFSGHSACTQVIEQTLSPTWDEMVLLQKIELCGELPQLSEDPPLVVVNVFDQDNVVSVQATFL